MVSGSICILKQLLEGSIKISCGIWDVRFLWLLDVKRLVELGILCRCFSFVDFFFFFSCNSNR